jgi:hypothetical protein
MFPPWYVDVALALVIVTGLWVAWTSIPSR